MNPFRRKPTEDAPQRDPAIVAIACRTRAGWDLMTVRSGAAALELVATERFAAEDARASQWIDGQRAGHRFGREFVAEPALVVQLHRTHCVSLP